MLHDPDAPPPDAHPTPDRTEALTPAESRFRSCRWRTVPDGNRLTYCAHRDVLPFAGTTGFNPEAWCPGCEFFKLRRTPRKRSANQLDD